MTEVIARAVVADDRTLIADGISMLLQNFGDIEITQTVSDLDLLATALSRHQPDILILGVEADAGGQPDHHDADEVVAGLRSAGFDVPVLCLTTHDDPVRIARYLQAGVSGLLTTDATPAELVRAVHDVVAGRAGLAPSQVADVIGHLTGSGAHRHEVPPEHGGLTRRESEVLIWLTAGASTEQISRALDISKHTVRTHVQNLLAKLGVHSKLEASAYAVRHGLVKPGH